jgi:hypothetical protein
MSLSGIASRGAASLRFFLCSVLLAVLSACGGGGGGGGGSSGSGPSADLTGQVAKGLTSGATVTLYRINDAGVRTVIFSTVSDAQGGFSLPTALTVGQVYLLEAIGGQYINEATGLTAALTAPMRAVFVASGSERRFAISAVSEAVALQVEQSSSPTKWSASSVANATTVINTAFGLPSPFDLRFVDLTHYSSGSDPSLTDADFTLSLHIGFFAGFMHERQLRDSGQLFSATLRDFRQMVTTNNPDPQLMSDWLAGLVRFVERVPSLANSKASLYTSLGLLANSNAEQLSGAESSGESSATVPNGVMRILLSSSGSSDSTDTVFNSRGALVGYRLGTVNSGLGFAYLGSSSVADVYATEETAIGRWNKGYYYDYGVTYNAAQKQFNTSQAHSAPMGNWVYAAGVPASNPPSCGVITMAPQAQTKPYKSADGSLELTLDASSRLVFQFNNGITFAGYSLVLRDAQSNVYTLASTGGTSTPLQGARLDNKSEFNSHYGVPLPTGDTLTMRGLLAGAGATKAVITMDSNIVPTRGLAAAFAQVGSIQTCTATNFAAGSVSPIPSTGDYNVSFKGFTNPMSGLSFLSDGTPKLAYTAPGVVATQSMEKRGNSEAGIGILMPPFLDGLDTVNIPRAYFYVKSPFGSAMPQSGNAEYRLVASTPYLTRTGNQLISANTEIQSARLKIQFDQYPMGTASNWYGACELTINGQVLQDPYGGRYSRDSGTCDGLGFTAGITSGSNRYAVALYSQVVSGTVQAEAALLFEKVP